MSSAVSTSTRRAASPHPRPATAAVVRSWVRADHAALDPVLYRAVRSWLDRDWPFRLDRVRATGLTRDRLPGWPANSLAGNFRVTQRRSACHRTTSGSRSVTHNAGLGTPSLIRNADYLLVPPRVCTRVPMHRIASYGTRWPAEPRCMFTVPRCGGLFVWDCRELAHSYCRSAPWTVGGIGLVRHSHLPS